MLIREENLNTLDHPPILISDNEEFSDITQLLENEDDDDTLNNYWDRNKTREVKCCQKEVRERNLAQIVWRGSTELHI